MYFGGGLRVMEMGRVYLAVSSSIFFWWGKSVDICSGFLTIWDRLREMATKVIEGYYPIIRFLGLRQEPLVNRSILILRRLSTYDLSYNTCLKSVATAFQSSPRSIYNKLISLSLYTKRYDCLAASFTKTFGSPVRTFLNPAHCLLIITNHLYALENC